ncbi:MAG: MFS transporter [Gammaproteobacteria bacterium]|nr:MFS transporter [Gammaproteobacteria bacterium]
MFDFANSGYTTVVVTAVFNAWFVSVIAGGANWATLAWTAALSLSYAVNLVSAPLIGAWADLRARKRELLIGSAVLCIVGTAALSLCGPGNVALALCIVVIGNFAFGMGENLIAAFLPELVRPEAMGKVSGWGWGLGYIGGLLTLGLCLYWIQGTGRSVAEAVPQTMLITAAVFALAVLPTVFLLRERARPQALADGQVAALALARVRSALRGGDGLLDLRRLLACIVCYQAGVQTVIVLAAIYTEQALGFTTAQSITLILVVNITAALGAFAFGALQDRFGHRRVLAVTLLGWLLAVGMMAFANGMVVVWIAANLVGICLGASQSAGRALVGYLCPPQREAEIFGLWGLAVKLASILGPLSYGIVNAATAGNHRLAIGVTALFFVTGLLLLMRVDVARGHAAAHGVPVQREQ